MGGLSLDEASAP